MYHLKITILILFIASMITLTVNGEKKDTFMLNNKEYQEAEVTYAKQVKNILADASLKNAGVTMTKVIDANGKRDYTICINHKNINYMNKSELESLEMQLDTLEMNIENSICRINFLDNE